MHTIDRRTLLTSFAAAAAAKALRGAPSAIDDTLRSGIARHKIPAVVGMAASEAKTLYSGAFGIRDSSGVPVKMDSIFAIASMTKAVTTVAALQLVEQGKVKLEEPVAKHLPQLAKLEVLEGFDANGKASLRPSTKPVTLHHLLTHTAASATTPGTGTCSATPPNSRRQIRRRSAR